MHRQIQTKAPFYSTAFSIMKPNPIPFLLLILLLHKAFAQQPQLGPQLEPSPFIFAEESPTATEVPQIEDTQCSNLCYRVKFRAVRDCQVRRFPLPACQVTKCKLKSGRRGWKCASGTASPTPAPTCPHRCYKTRRRANRDCDAPMYANSACMVKRCRLPRRNNRRGWTCASSETVTVSPMPSTTPSASFEDLTFRTGRLKAARTQQATDGSDGVFDVSYDVTLASGGVVSLDALSDSVDAITCSRNASVRIQLVEDAPVTDLIKMYPVGAILVISRDLFGQCNVTDPVLNEDETEEDQEIREATDQSADFADTFLYIESVSGTSRDAVVRGVPTGYFALFDQANIEIVLQEPSSSNNGSSVVRDVSAESFPVLVPNTRDLTLNIEADVFSLGPLMVTVKGAIQERGGFKSFQASWGNGVVDVELRFINEWEVSLQLEAAFKVGVFPRARTVKTLISQVLYGIPSIDFLETLDLGPFKLPTFKLGFYFELPLILQLEASIEKQIGTQITASYKTTRTEFIMFLRGPYTDLDIGVDSVTLDPSSRTFEFTPTFDASTPIQVNALAFLGVRPQFAAYVPIFSARVSVDFGVEVKAEALLGEQNAFPPALDNSIVKVGDCDTCHHLQVTGTAKVRNAGIFANAGLDLSVSQFGFNITIPLRKQLLAITFPGNPSVSIDIAKGCFIEQYDGRAEVCGEQCCDSDVGMCQMIGSPPTEQCDGPSPTPDPTPSPATQTPTPTPTPGSSSSCYTDPHLRTFDGFSYDCQAIGEFILVKSDAAGFEIQARFSGPDTSGTVSTGLAIRANNTPTVQVSISSDASSTNAVSIGSCPVLMYVDGVSMDVTTGTGQDNLISVTVSDGQSIQISLKSGISVSFRVRTSTTFGCYFEFLNTFLPDSITQRGDIMGLLGSPNGNPFDDWMTPSGEVLDPPQTSAEKLFEPAYTYCTTNWCIRDEAKSAFTYENGTSFDDFNGCNEPYKLALDLSMASEALQNLCGNDAACLVDGLVGDIDDARIALNAQAEVDLLSGTNSVFRFEPTTIAVESTVNVKITLDVRGRPASQLAELEGFSLIRIDSDSGEPEGDEVLRLEDTGSAVVSDDIAGDLIFSNVLAVRSELAGERLSFRAIPVVAGTSAPDSPLVFTALNAVRSYSRESNIGVEGEERTEASISSLAGLELIVRYSWPRDQDDLDTATAFNNELVGFSCVGEDENYVSFSGDDTSSGGTETIIVELDRARNENVWNDSTTVTFRAGWFTPPQRGPATLRMALRNASTKDEISSTALLIGIDPGVQSGCAEKIVGSLMLNIGADVKLELTKGAPNS